MTKGINVQREVDSAIDTKRENTDQLARLIISAALEKKATNIAIMEMREVSGVADYFIICTGGSEQQIRAICDEIRHQAKETLREIPWQKEGESHYSWVVLDYVDVVVHIMNPEKRGYYQLERLWGDANIEYIDDDSVAPDIQLFSNID
ncbi:MAG: ribosome silencing factor [Rhodothermales bacterium]|nr:ribosome silencing factor [Rhodothermales bacterium]